MNKRIVSYLWVAAMAAALPALNGCAPLVIGGGAAAATAAVQERGFKATVSDTVIHAKINDKWYEHDKELFRDAGVQVTEGRVLLTGRVQSQQARIDAVRLAWQVQGVKEVINEIQLAKKGEGSTFLRDTEISTKLKAKILLDRKVRSINYSIETVAGVIYLMGIAQNEAELERVKDHARNIPYARGIVSYVEMKDDPRRHKS